MPSSGDGTGWDETLPQDSDNVQDGPLEMRDIRIGTRIRIEKEHSTLAGSSAGGEHRNGSAKAYYAASFPTKRPDGVADLDAADKGRIYINPNTGVLYWWHETTLSWHTVNLSLAGVPYARFSDQKAAGTNSGSFSSGAWRTRDLNTEEYDPLSFASVASNEVTLAAGTYRFVAYCPAHQVDGHRCRIRDTTNNVTLGESSNENAPAGVAVSTTAVVTCEATFSAEVTISVQHQCATTKANTGFGLQCTFGTDVERYTVLHVYRINQS